MKINKINMEQKNNSKDFGDFGKKWIGKKCIIVFYDGTIINGRVNDDQKYFIEFIDSANRTAYINKAYIREIIPEE